MSNLHIGIALLYADPVGWEIAMSSSELTRGERLQIMLSPEELKALDDFRFKQRMPSRAAAVRDLLRLGLAAVGLSPAETGAKSGEFGVLGTGPDSHRPGPDG